MLLAAPKGDYSVDAAFVVIEILSDDDRMSRVIEKLNEYALKGIAHIRVIDPRLKKMFTFRNNALQEVPGDGSPPMSLGWN